MKARHGLTPPMRDAARRMFDRTPAVDQKTMQKLEDDLLLIAQVQRFVAPGSSGYCFQDVILCFVTMLRPLPDDSSCQGDSTLPHARSLMPSMLRQCWSY